MRLLKATLALACTLAIGIPALPASAVSKHCVRMRVAGIGEVCRRADGLLELRSPGGRLLAMTHGPDGAEAPRAGTSASAAGSQRKATCASTTENHVELIYARAADDTDQYASQAAGLRTSFEQANWVLNDAALATGPEGADYKVLCSGTTPVVHNAVLPTSKANDSFGTIVADLNASATPTRGPSTS